MIQTILNKADSNKVGYRSYIFYFELLVKLLLDQVNTFSIQASDQHVVDVGDNNHPICLINVDVVVSFQWLKTEFD